MIDKINLLNIAKMHSNKTVKKSVNAKNVTTFQSNTVKKTSNFGDYLNTLAFANSIAFKGNYQLNELEASIIGQSEIRIPDLVTLNQDIELPRKKMPKGLEKLNAAGLNVKLREEDGLRICTISNDKGNIIAKAEINTNATPAELPTITYKQGKYMPEITLKADCLNGKSIKMLAGSELSAKNFKIIMPGQYEPTIGGGYKHISFMGNIALTTLNKESKTVEAVDGYVNSGLFKESVRGDFADVVEKYNPNIIIPAGGFGERFKNITREHANKPSQKLPTDSNYRIIGTTLNLAASAGILRGDGNDNIVYLSQNHEIPMSDNVFWTPVYKTDGGAIAEGMKRGIIDTNFDSIILNADIFTNADITRAYNSLKTLPNAALVIPYYPVSAERAKSFGLLGIEQDENDNYVIKQFVEKPAYTDEAPDPNDFTIPGDYDKAMAQYDEAQMALNPCDDETYLANPGMYFLSKEASKVLMAQGILTPELTGLGVHVMPKIIQLINDGKLVDKDGNKMKAYTVALERKGGKLAVWDDIGTAEAYLKLIKDVAAQVEQFGVGEENKYFGAPEFVMEDFASNTDLKTGIVYDSLEAREALSEFAGEFQVDDIRGNIFVAGN